MDARLPARAVAWSGAVIFAAALLYFLYSYAVTFGEISAGEPGRQPIAVNLALFTAFALHHSIFARNRVREFVRSVVTARLERSAYVWVASLMLIGVCYSWQPVPGVLWQVQQPWSWAFVPAQVFGVWLSLRSAGVIDVWDLAGVRQTSRDNDGPASAHAETTEFKAVGPYGWVRHPIYLGWMLMVFSVGTMTMTRLSFAVISCVYLLIAIPFEERTLRVNSGRAYDDYIRRVPWKLIPRVY